MRIEQLSYLIELANSSSINAAAEKLHISQQSLNISLKNLEKELNAKLFLTSKSGTVLTTQGKLAFETAVDIISKLNKLKNNLNDFHTDKTKEITGEIICQSTPALLEFILPSMLTSFYEQYPKIALNITVRDIPIMFESLQKKEIDLAIFGIRYSFINQHPEYLPLPPELKFIPLFQHKYCIAAALNHPIAKLKSISLKKVLKYPLVINAPSFDIEHNADYLWLKNYGEPKIKMGATSLSLYINAITKGSCIGFFPYKKFCNENVKIPDNIALIPIKEADTVSTIGYCYNTEKPISAATQYLIDELITFCR